MRKICLNLLLFLTLFFLADIAKADYDAVVVNPSGSKCSFSNNSTGFCFYKDSNLSTHYSDVYWLDTGDKVTILSGYDSIKSNDPSLCSDYYVYTNFYYNAKPHYGYYCNAYLKAESLLTDELKKEFTDAGFPESYHEALAILKVAHPNWKFNTIDTKLSFEEAVNGEANRVGANLVQLSASNNYAYMATDSASFDYLNDKFIPYDSKASSNAWYNANRDTIAYYMDPRNFLKDEFIFQFEGLAYDENILDESFLTTIKSVFKDDYMLKFTDDFLKAGKESKMSPVYLAALSKQEVANGATPGTAISGEYNGMYNFYNIGATGDDYPVYNGLKFASYTDSSTLRPWNTEYKAIAGGALWMAEKYVKVGQDTSYFKRWNVVYNYLVSTGKVEDPYNNFQHQYMTNIMAVTSEAATTYKSYYSADMLDLEFIFYIPVYNNMPEKTSLPTSGGWPNHYLSSLSLNGNNIAGFSGDVTVYNYYLDVNTPELVINAIPKNNTAKVEGNGNFKITENTKKEIVVTAENGSKKTYTINITLTGEKSEDPIDVTTTLNNAGIKNSDNYLSGFDIGIDISYIKQKINNANKDSKVSLKNSSDKEKNSGSIVTGDKVEITVGEETKNYEVIIYGDINGDGAINALDFIQVKKCMLKEISLSGVKFMASDINRDGAINALDFIQLKKYMLGESTAIKQ